jgi:hypothetical protein
LLVTVYFFVDQPLAIASIAGGDFYFVNAVEVF